MKLVAKHLITNGVITYKKGDQFETDEHFTVGLVPRSASYLEPQFVDAKKDEGDIIIPDDLETLKVTELKELCKKLEISDLDGKKKEELIDLIELKVFDEENK